MKVKSKNSKTIKSMKEEKIELKILTHANVASNAANREKDTCPPPCSDGGLRSHCKQFCFIFLLLLLSPAQMGGSTAKAKTFFLCYFHFLSIFASLKMEGSAATAKGVIIILMFMLYIVCPLLFALVRWGGSAGIQSCEMQKS